MALLVDANFILFQVALPAVLAAAAILNISILAYLYILLLLATPFLANGTKHPTKFLTIVLFISALFSIADVIFNFASFIFQSFDYNTQKCRKLDRLFLQFGLSRYQINKLSDVLTQALPKHIVFLFTSFLFLRASFTKNASEKKVLQCPNESDTKFAEIVQNCVFLIALLLCGFIHPSLASLPYFALYFYMFLRWTLDKSMSKKEVQRARVCFVMFAFVHISLLHCYQLPGIQRFVKPETLWARLLGFSRVIKVRCDRFWYPAVTPSWYWPEVAQPFVLLVSYFVTAHQLVLEEDRKVTNFKTQRHGIPVQLIEHHESTTPAAQIKILLSDSTNEEGKHEVISENFNLAAVLSKTLEFAKSQSYILTLFTMMAWSLCFHSWMTFALLAASCVIWMSPDPQKFCFKAAPIFALYAMVLLVLQFIFSLNLTGSELSDESPSYLRQLGIEKPRDRAPFFDLLLKCIFTCTIFLSVKQRLVESKKRPDLLPEEALENGQRHSLLQASDQKSTHSASNIKAFAEMAKMARFKRLLSDNWIFAILAVILLISLRDPVVIYRLLYMVFFHVFLLLFQVLSLAVPAYFQISFTTWRKSLYLLWMSIIISCMAIVTVIYTFQFHGVPEFYGRYLSEDLIRSLGLERVSSGELLIRLLSPISLLICTLIQVNFFDEALMQKTKRWEETQLSKIFAELQAHSEVRMDFFRQHFSTVQTLINLRFGKRVPVPPEAAAARKMAVGEEESPPKLLERQREKEKEQEEIRQKQMEAAEWDQKDMKAKVRVYLNRIEGKFQNLVNHRDRLIEIFWRVLEIHFDRVLSGLMIFVAINEVCACNVPYVVFVSVTFPREQLFNPLAPLLAIWSSLLVVCKMVYQMDVVRAEAFEVDCTRSNESASATSWAGFRKTPAVSVVLWPYLCLCLGFAARSCLRLRMALYRKRSEQAPPLRGVVFPKINRKKADKSAANSVKFLANFFFYKFGFEICCVASVLTIGYRRDLYSVVYALILIGSLVMERRDVSRLWLHYTVFLATMLVIQYLLCLGMPRIFCLDYPWSSWDANMIEWLFLPDYSIQPDALKLFADFCLLLVVSCQGFVFQIEDSKDAAFYPGGQNDSEIGYTSLAAIWKAKLQKRPLPRHRVKKKAIGVPDFISNRKILLDEAKNLLFVYFYWITLGVIFATGTSTVTLFNLGYVLACFYFLWHGNSLILRPMASALQLWDSLIFYNVCVIFAKTFLQVVGCVYLSHLYRHFCWLIQLLGVACLKAGGQAEPAVSRDILGECEVPQREAGVFYDGVCFLFLIVQRRIFLSEYFKHVIAEYRGAELIAKITLKDIKDAEESEAKMLAQVKQKVEGVRARNATASKEMKRTPTPEDEHSPSQLTPTVPSIAVEHSHERPPSPTLFSNNGDVSVLEMPVADSAPRAKPATLFAIDYSPSSPPHRISPSVPRAKELPLKFASLPLASILRPTAPTSEAEDEGGWFTPSAAPLQAEKMFDEKITEKEGGVKGLGPLQLLHFVFSRGSFREALRESRKIEATHEKLEKEMEQAYGKADHEAIRRAIFSQKQKKPKADYDEDNFEDPYTSGREDSVERRKSTIPFAPAELSALDRQRSKSLMPETTPESPTSTKEIMEDLALKLIESQSFDEEEGEQIREKIKKRMKSSRLYHYYVFGKFWLQDLWKFILMFCDAVLESTIQNLMFLSRDYRYVAQTLTTEKKLHKELADDDADDESDLSLVQLERKRSFLRFQIENRKASVANMGIEDDDMQRLHEAIAADVKEANIADALETPDTSEMDPAPVVSKTNGLWEPEMSEEELMKKIEKKQLKAESAAASRKPSLATLASELRSTAELKHLAELGKSRLKSRRSLPGRRPTPQSPNNQSIVTNQGERPDTPILSRRINSQDKGNSSLTDSSGGDVTAYFSENKVPGTLVSMLIIQFVLIILDRALFLRKFLVGKVVFQVFLITFVHVWMFLYLPAATDRLFVSNTTCKFWYFSKVVYFIISAKQIRSGYPKRSIGNIMTNSYSRINLYLYQLFMLVPFLFELRCLMDWIWKDTALDVSDWFLFNEIFSHISMLKCSQKVNSEQLDSKSPQKGSLEKYVKGGLLLVLIVFLIWFPLVLFSMANTVGIRSLPVECSVQLTISGYQPLYESSAQLENIKSLNESEYEQLQYAYRQSKGAQSYMSDYTNDDVVRAVINGNSTSRWMISPPSRHALIQQMETMPKIDFKFSWYFKRAPDPNLKFGVAEDFRVVSLSRGHAVRAGLVRMLRGEQSDAVRIPNLLPPFLKVPGEGKADAVAALLVEHVKPGTPTTNAYADILLSLSRENGHEWMIDSHFDPVKLTEEEVLNGIALHGFVDKVFSTSFLVQFLTGGGILGLYLSLVLLVGKFMRDTATGSMPKIMFDQLPNVDDILQMCLDIMLVREAGELELEEELFGRLVFLFRSPALLIKMTRDKIKK